MTAITTMVAPLMTPLLMKLLAGTLVEVSFFKMMMEIVKIVIVPISAALLHDYLKHAPLQGRRIVLGIAAVGAGWLAFLALGGWGWVTTVMVHAADKVVDIMHFLSGIRLSITAVAAILIKMVGIGSFLWGAVVAGVVYHWLTRWFARLDSWMPVASMAGIVYFTTVTTAAGRENLLEVGALLFFAAALHNVAGYLFGYWFSRASGLDKNSARSVAFEVGLQNGGMASGLAGAMGKLGTVGLAAAIFSPWMNVSGSVLANYWRKRPVK